MKQLYEAEILYDAEEWSWCIILMYEANWCMIMYETDLWNHYDVWCWSIKLMYQAY